MATWLEVLPLCWAVGLVVAVLLAASLIVSAPAFIVITSCFDHPGPAWFGALFGYLSIAVLSIRRRVGLATPAWDRIQVPFSLLAFAGYTHHLLLLRWPWLVGTATSDSRLTVWGAALSSTWKGVPLAAFAELLGLATIFVQAHFGVVGSLANRLGSRFDARHRRLCAAVAVASYGIASAVVNLLATGRR